MFHRRAVHQAAALRAVSKRVGILFRRALCQWPVLLHGAVLLGGSDGRVVRADRYVQGSGLRRHMLRAQGMVRHERPRPRLPVRLGRRLPYRFQLCLEHRFGRVRLRLLPEPLSAVSLVTARRGTALQADGEIASPPMPRRPATDA